MPHVTRMVCMIMIVAITVFVAIVLTAGVAISALYVLGFILGALWRARPW